MKPIVMKDKKSDQLRQAINAQIEDLSVTLAKATTICNGLTGNVSTLESDIYEDATVGIIVFFGAQKHEQTKKRKVLFEEFLQFLNEQAKKDGLNPITEGLD